MNFGLNQKVLRAAAGLALSLVCAVASAQEEKKGEGEFGLKFGHLGGGTVEYQLKTGDSDLDTVETGSSYSGGAFLSQSVWGHLHGAVSFDLHYLRKEQGSGETALDVAGGLKYVLTNKTRTVSLRPAAMVGFAILPDVWVFKSSQYATLKLTVELAFLTQKGTGLLIEIGNLQTLTGSDSKHDIDAKSMMLLRGGLIL